MSGPSTDGPPPPETVAPTAATAAAGTVVIPDWDDGAKPVSEFDAGSTADEGGAAIFHAGQLQHLSHTGLRFPKM
jgi:hypothetical protein